MSPLFVALPPADLPSVAYEPTALHTAQLLSTSTKDTHTVRSGDTVYDIAAKHGVSVRQIIVANNLKEGGRWIMPGDRLVIPGSGSGSTKAPAAEKKASGSGRSSGGTVTVRAGDTLSGIATKHGTTVAALTRANGINAGSFIYPGQKLTLPGGDTSSSRSKAPSSGGGSIKANSGGTVTVRAGDTLSGIAAKHGVSVNALAKASGINAGSFIYPGQKLTLPGGSSSAAKDTTTPKDSAPASFTKRDRPFDESNVGDYKVGEYVQDTFLHYRYSNATARAAAANRDYLATVEVPSKAQMRQLIVDTSRRYGVDSKLMLALSFQESGWNHRAVSPANAIGAMQVIPTSGDWASGLVGRRLNLLDPADNVEASVAIMRSLLASAPSRDHAIGAYYQGLGSVRQHGLFADSKRYVANITYYMTTL